MSEHTKRGLPLLALLLVAASCSAQGFDAYGGSLDLTCPAAGTANTRAGNFSANLSSASASGNTITVNFSPGVSLWEGNAIRIAGTGTAMDTPAGALDAIATDNSNDVAYWHPQTTTQITVTRTGIGTVGSVSVGTVSVAAYYVALINSRWWVCTPLEHAMFLTGATLVQFPTAGSGVNNISPSQIANERYVPRLNTTPIVSPSNATFNAYLNLALRYRGYGFNTLFEQSSTHAQPWDFEGTGATGWNDADGYPPQPLFGFPLVLQELTSQYSSFRNINTPINTVAGNGYPLVKRSVYRSNFVRGVVDPFTFDDGDGWTAGFKAPAYYKYMVKYLGGFGLTSPILPLNKLHNEFLISLMDESDEGGGTGGGADYPTEASGGVSTPFPATQPDGQLVVNTGKEDVELGLIGLIESPAAGVVAANVKGLGGKSWLFTSSQAVASKAEFASWLQANADNSSTEFGLTTSGALSGTTATITFSGGNGNFPGTSYIHPYIPHEEITVTGCSNSALNVTGGTVTATQPTNISYAVASGTASGVTGCVVTDGPGYASIAALNAKWGSNYSSFGTAASTFTEATGCTGASTFPCAYTTAHNPVTPLTVEIKDSTAGVILAADDGSGQTAGTQTQSGNLWYNDQGSNGGSVTYNTGAISIGSPVCVSVIDHIAGNGTTATVTTDIAPGPCFVASKSVTIAGSPTTAFNGTFTIASVAGSTFTFSSTTNATAYSGTASVSGIPSGDAISVTYQTGGWGVGHGLLDEDGTCPSKVTTCWIPLAPFARNGSETAVETDLEQFTLHWFKWILKSQHDAIKLYDPANMMEPGTIGSWGGPPRREVLWVTDAYADWAEFDGLPIPDLSCSENGSNQVVAPALSLCTNFTDNQARVNYIGTYYNGPWYMQYSDVANADSEMAGQSWGGNGPNFTTQGFRGLWRPQYMSLILGATYTGGANTGVSPIVALANWPLGNGFDNGTQSDGFMNRRLNWLDGLPAAPTQDSIGYDYECENYSGQPAGYTWCPAAQYGNVMTGVAAANTLWLKNIARTQVSGQAGGAEGH